MKKINMMVYGTMFAAALMAGNGMNAFAAEADPEEEVIEAEAEGHSDEDYEEDEAEAVYDYVIGNDDDDGGGAAAQAVEAVNAVTNAIKPITSYFMPSASHTQAQAQAQAQAAEAASNAANALKPITSYFMPSASHIQNASKPESDEDEDFDDEDFDEEFEGEPVVNVAYGGGVNIEHIVPGTVGNQTQTGGYGSRDQEINAAIDQALNVPEYQKSEWTKMLEEFAANWDFISKPMGDDAGKIIDDMDLPEFEREAAKQYAKLGAGFVSGEIYSLIAPGYGSGKKLYEAAAYFSKANDAQKGTAKFYNACKGVQKGLQGIVGLMPGGGAFNKGIDAVDAGATYLFKRIGSFIIFKYE